MMMDSKDLEAEAHPLQNEDRQSQENLGNQAGKEDPFKTGTPPQSRLSRCRTVAFFLSLFICLFVLFIISFVIPCPDRPVSQRVWTVRYNTAVAFDFLAMEDLNRDRVQDVLFLYKTFNSSNSANRSCADEGFPAPCTFAAAVSGASGSVLWERPVVQDVALVECSVPQPRDSAASSACILMDTSGSFLAINSLTGGTLWSHPGGLKGNASVLSPLLRVPDSDGDGTPDLLIIAREEEEVSGRVYSGSTGLQIGRRGSLGRDGASGSLLHTTRTGAHYVLFPCGACAGLCTRRTRAAGQMCEDSEAAPEAALYPRSASATAGKAAAQDQPPRACHWAGGPRGSLCGCSVKQLYEEVTGGENLLRTDPVWESRIATLASRPLSSGAVRYLMNVPGKAGEDVLLVSAEACVLLDGQELTPTWTFSATQVRRKPTLGHYTQDTVVVAIENGTGLDRQVRLLDLGTGAVLWSQPLPGLPGDPRSASLLTADHRSAFFFWGLHVGENQTAAGGPQHCLYLFHPTLPHVLLQLANVSANIAASDVVLLEPGRHAATVVLTGPTGPDMPGLVSVVKHKVKDLVLGGRVLRLGAGGPDSDQAVRDRFSRLRFRAEA